MMFWNENGLFTREQPADDRDWSEGYQDYLKTIEDLDDERATKKHD